MVSQVLEQVYLEQRPPGVLQDGFPGTGTGKPGAETSRSSPGWFSWYWDRQTWSRGLQDGFSGTGTVIPGAEMDFQVLGQLILEQRPPGWVFMYVYLEQRPPGWFSRYWDR